MASQEIFQTKTHLYHAPNANRSKQSETETNGSALSFLIKITIATHEIVENRKSRAKALDFFSTVS